MSMLGLEKTDLRFILNLFKMNLRDRYLGSLLGGVWAVANPILMFGIYTFVFGYVFKARIPGADTTLGFATWLIGSYGAWMATLEGLISATNSVAGSSGLVKNMVFKTETLPIAASLTGLVPLAVSIVFMFILLLVDGNTPTWHVLLSIPCVVVHFLFIIALGFYFSAIHVFMRDFGIVLPNLLLMILFVSPIFYPLESMPKILQGVSGINPFYILCESYRETFIFHRMPNLPGLAYVCAFSGVVGILGLRFFRRLKGNFDAAL
ncbi:MAG: ABC transporter permease [Planctomycetes bacterium]|nr:ABC transporter permease [Planctomycetota bacterium]